jgi:Protein of unknown function (DUF1036)
VDARDKPGHDDLDSVRYLSFAFSSALVALPAALISFLISAVPALADLKLCNRMSYVVEVAIGIDDKAATATRGWFRIDPAACRVVAQGTLTADRILLNARARRLWRIADSAKRRRHTLHCARQFRDRSRPSVPQRADARPLYASEPDADR